MIQIASLSGFDVHGREINAYPEMALYRLKAFFTCQFINIFFDSLLSFILRLFLHFHLAAKRFLDTAAQTPCVDCCSNLSQFEQHQIKEKCQQEHVM
jgi:hypothetical protein